jgi:Peptidase family M23
LGPLVAAAAAALFAFWPQAGVLGRDLTFANSVDLDPAAGATLDPWCGHRTYDGHTGEDITIRSFREVDVGVPVFSLTDGTMFEVQDGMYDYRFGPTVSTFDNHLIVAAPDGRFFVYGHLRHGLGWKKGQVVHAGDQLGWSASSGNSAWPHLHLTELAGDAPHELFAGPCNTQGGDTFANTHPFADATYARNVVVSAKPFSGKAQLPWDQATRTGTFVVGTRDVYLRLELGAYSGGTPTVQIGDVRDPSPQLVPETPYAGTAFDLHERVHFDRPGTTTLRVTLGAETLVETSLRVVARAAQARNRPPFRVAAQVTQSGSLAQCVITSPFAVRDPDFDVVRYRYVWTAGAKRLRSVTSAMLSDLVRVPAGTTPRCSVTPSDGKLSASPSSSG